MSVVIVILGRGGETRYQEDELPLAIGGGGSGIRPPSTGDEGVLAHISVADGDLFVQPAEGAAGQVICNGSPVAASRWLRDGDVLQFDSRRLVVGRDGDVIRLRLLPAGRPARSDSPPAIEPPTPASRTIRPTAFQPASRRATRRSWRPSLRPMNLALWVAALLLVTGAWFVLSARSVLVEVTPAPEVLRISGRPLAVRLGERYLMLPGAYTATAELAGFRPLQVAFQVDREPRQEFRFSLERLPGLLDVSSGDVTGARVEADGAAVGEAPLAGQELAPGEHRVVVRHPRYRVFETTVLIEGGGAAQHLEAVLEPAWAAVTVRSVPGGAAVSVDGRPAGTTPARLELLEGDRSVELMFRGYKPQRRRVAVVAGEDQELPLIRLEPSDGNLILQSEPTAVTVTVDGAYRGATPLDLRLAPDREHMVQLSKAGYRTATERVTVDAEESRTVSVVLEAEYGEVVVSSRPANAQVLVDGEPRGRSGETLRLTAAEHLLEIRKDGYVSFTTSVTPHAGLAQSIDVTLEEVGAQQLLAEAIKTPQGAELRLIPAGRFQMGASRREPGRRANEALRQVELTRPFYLGVREVTNREFREFKKDHLSGKAGNQNLEIDHHPVVRVRWQDAARYCNWLSRREGLTPFYQASGGTLVATDPLADGYRLPSEAEWAWAARYPDGRTARKYPWGASLPIPANAGNYGDTSARGLLDGALPDYHDGHPATAPVASFEPDAHGIHDLGGNVAEWVHDVHWIPTPRPGEAERDPMGPTRGQYHVIRGAGWMDDKVTELRLSYRDYGDQPRPDVGFRIARCAVTGPQGNGR